MSQHETTSTEMSREQSGKKDDDKYGELGKKQADEPKAEHNDDAIYFLSLSPMEQDKLIARLHAQIVEQNVLLNNQCCLFCRWVCSSFLPNASAPAPTALSDNLELIDENFAESEDQEPDRLFWEGGNSDKIREYLDKIKRNEKVTNKDTDVYSLAIACKQYMENDVIFIDSGLYQKIVDAYKGDPADAAFAIKRLPFLLYQRSLVKYILDIAHKEDQTEFYEDWGLVLFKDDENREINGKIVEDLTTAEFDVVDPCFYEK
ncbi:hypothetical protein ECANGB1_1173 [Enterospora canceri]|uniref:Uncharacterized protein n=1 Tax=Enterospora canceri TaxID=1081671 RepID=A0A1Y1S7D5_9MICR|nr:hypothetical protein ECANGB1_1173 [Enterospora canceri]